MILLKLHCQLRAQVSEDEKEVEDPSEGTAKSRKKKKKKKKAEEDVAPQARKRHLKRPQFHNHMKLTNITFAKHRLIFSMKIFSVE